MLTPGCLTNYGSTTFFHITMPHDPSERTACIWVFYFHDEWQGHISNVYCGEHTVGSGHKEIIE